MSNSVRATQDPTPSVKQKALDTEKTFSPKEGEAVKKRIAKVWDLLDQLEAEVKQLQETQQI